jgi:hypothetical protein
VGAPDVIALVDAWLLPSSVAVEVIDELDVTSVDATSVLLCGEMSKVELLAATEELDTLCDA